MKGCSLCKPYQTTKQSEGGLKMIGAYNDTEGLFPKPAILKKWQTMEKIDKPVHQKEKP